MKVVGNFNKISEKLKAEIPVLKPGQIMTFQCLWGVPNPDPDPTEKIKNPMLYGKNQLSTYFRIFDPYITDSKGIEVGGYVDVGAVEVWNKEQPETYKCFIPGFGGHQFSGKFSLSGSKVDESELFEVLWLSPQREGNPHRDKTIKPMFKLIDVVATTKSNLTNIDILREALTLVKYMKEEDAKVLMSALNQKKFDDPVVMMGALSELAKNKPGVVLAAYNDPEKENKAILADAIDQLILEYNPATRKVTMDKSEILTVAPGEDVLNILNGWIKTADNGQSVFGLIKTKVAAKNEGKSEPKTEKRAYNKKQELEPA